uniref:Zinc finger protein 568-like n=1 Tax=Poecilia formosa TaxID=48698 RepID=A0A087YA28_POEFO
QWSDREVFANYPTAVSNQKYCLVSTLVISGVQSAEDLKYIQPEDIKNLLPVVQQRKLLESFKQGKQPYLILDVADPPCSSTSSLSSIPPISEQPSALKTPLMLCQNEQQNVSWSWPEDFQVSWNKMPLEIQTAIAKGKRPPPDKRRQMIRILADEMQKYEANPTRSQCLTVCQKITRQYPDSFADMTPSGKLIAGGYSSLLSQLKTRIENINRCGTFRSYRSSGPCGIAGVKRGPTDMYGCTRFQPELPPEETDDTVEEKRQRLQSTFNKYGINGHDRPEVTDLMETTYSLQRQHINRIPAPSITDLQINWPFLFTQRGIFSHFELLTDVPLLHVLELSIEECGNAVVEYFRTKVKASSVQTILAQKATGDLTFLVIQLLMAHFNESPDSLMLTTDEYATAADVNTSLSLPASPRLILCGNEQALAGWMVSIEGHVVFEGVQPTFLTGLAAVFATFYIFNLQYQDEAAKTLEFIQRRFIGINPERGTKTGNGRMVSKKTGKIIQKKKQTVNMQVSTLIKNLMDFECHLIQ